MKTLKIVVVMLILFMSVSAACAANETSDDIIDDDNHNVLKTMQNDVSAVAVSKTFTDFENEINVSTGVFDVMDDYKYNSDTDKNCTGINILKNLTINGNGHTIDADGQVRIFRIFANNVTINNLTLVNGNSFYGGAFLINQNSSLTTNNIYVANTTAGHSVVLVVGTYVSNNDRFVDCSSPMGVVMMEGPQFTANNVTMQSSSILNWGFIYTETEGVSITVVNSTFVNTVSNYSTAIKGTSRTVIKNSKFINLHSLISAGAIGLKSVLEAEIDNCTFTNVTSMMNGGAIVADVFGDTFTDGVVKISNSDFVDCRSGFGGALLILGGNLTMDNCNFKNSSAKFDGGAIYMSMSNANISNSTFEESHTLYDGNRGTFGGAIYCDNSELRLCENEFNGGIAQYGGALYCYDSTYYVLDNKFSDNKKPDGTYDDVFTEFDFASSLQGNNYSGNGSCDLNNTRYTTIVVADGMKLNLINNTIDVAVLPSRFDLRDWNWSTPVRDQGRTGSCWTFGSSGAIESAILRFLGIEMDVSENNLEDISLQYNHYGMWGYIEAGTPQIAVAYAVSWFGMVNSDYDPFDQLGKISPIIIPDNAIHFQDVIFVPGRVNLTDNDVLKRTILKYGALDIVYAADQEPPGLNPETSAQYNNETEPGDHSVTLIGWDDSYSASNLLITPPGDGAWIIKNSWGEQNGDCGYYYISYYDVNFVRDISVEYLLENTVRYNKNYQYDIIGKLDYVNATEYINQYVALADDLIAGVGTYFNETGVEYGVEVYVNGVLRHVQNGLSPFEGFHTIQLDTFIPIKQGDVFAVKISSNSVPVMKYSRMHYLQNTSRYLLDGTWKDAYDDSEACVVKVYTIENPIEANDLVKIYKNESAFEVNIGKANQSLSFVINGITYNRTSDENGDAQLAINLPPGNYSIKTIFNETTIENSIEVLPTLIAENLVKYFKNESQFDIQLIDGQGNPVSGKNITMNINGVFYDRTTNENGMARLNINLQPGKYVLTAFDPLTGLQISFNITVLPTLTGKDLHMTYKDGSQFEATLVDGKGNPLANANIRFNINGVFYDRPTDENGIARLNIRLMPGEYIITSQYGEAVTSNKITIVAKEE